MSHRSVLALSLLLVPSLVSAAAPPPDPLAAIEVLLKKDVTDRGTLRDLITFAAAGGETGSEGLRVGNACRAQLLLRRTLAGRPAQSEAVAKVLSSRARVTLRLGQESAAGGALLLLSEVGTPAELLDLAEEVPGKGYS